MTLYAGVLYKLNPDAARTYLHALAERLDMEASTSERRYAEQRKLQAFQRLSEALQAPPAAREAAHEK